MTSEAQEAVFGGSFPDLVAWEFGVLTDDWDAPASSKPTLIGDEDDEDTLISCFAIGTERAVELKQDLLPLWSRFLQWLLPARTMATCFVSDEFWAPDGKWVEFGPAATAGLIKHLPGSPEATNRRGLYSLQLMVAGAQSLISLWWPSALGMFACVVTANSGSIDFQNLRQDARITLERLRQVQIYVRTSERFDNAGFVVLSRTGSWEDLRTQLEVEGWIDGMPLDMVR